MLAKKYNLQVGDRFELRVLGGVEILLGHHHSLLSDRVLYFYLRYLDYYVP